MKQRTKNKLMQQEQVSHTEKMVQQQIDAERCLFEQGGEHDNCGTPECCMECDDDWDEDRMDIIGQNGNTGEHYEDIMPNYRWNWYGEGEDAPVRKKIAPCSGHAYEQDRWEEANNYYATKAEMVKEGE